MRRLVAVWMFALSLTLLGGCGSNSAAPLARTPVPLRSTHHVAITVAGVGSKVTDYFALPAGMYQLAWKAHGELANFEVYVHQGDERRLFITELPPSPPSGETQYDSRGGRTSLEVHASGLSWTITISPL